jgi:hypothetical protein
MNDQAPVTPLQAPPIPNTLYSPAELIEGARSFSVTLGDQERQAAPEDMAGALHMMNLDRNDLSPRLTRDQAQQALIAFMTRPIRE